MMCGDNQLHLGMSHRHVFTVGIKWSDPALAVNPLEMRGKYFAVYET
jgi:hypothetical protein